MKKFLLLSLLALALPAWAADTKSADGFMPLFDGKSLDGWKASDKPGTFKVEDGNLIVNGDRSHLFYVGDVHGHEFKNFHLRAQIMTFPKSNSGVYFHTAWQETGWPDKGFEVQVNNTHPDPKKTAGLYDVKDNFTAPAQDEKWFTMEIIVQDNHVVTKVDGKVVTDWTQEGATGPKGHPGRIIGTGTIAIQGHDPGSKVMFKSIEVKPLD